MDKTHNVKEKPFVINDASIRRGSAQQIKNINNYKILDNIKIMFSV